MGRAGDMTPPLRWRLGVAGGVALVVLLVDQLTKLAVRAVGDALHVTVIPVSSTLFLSAISVLPLAWARGMASRLPCWRWRLLSLSPCTSFVHPSSPILRLWAWLWSRAALSGNAIDRLVFGFVTDFIATTFIDFPVFNVADIGITVGVVLALIGYMFLSPAAREVDATAELNARDEARAKRKAKQRGERARKIRERNER